MTVTLVDAPSDAPSDAATPTIGDAANDAAPDNSTPHPTEPSHGRIRPDSLASGSLAFVGAWGVGLAIVRLTGAAAVVLLLVATAVALLGAVLAGWWRLRRVSIVLLSTNATTTVGDDLTLSVESLDPSRASSSIHIDVLQASAVLNADGPTLLTLEMNDAGIVHHFDVTIRSAGAPGLMWWRRRIRIAVDPVHVAPLASGAPLPVDQCSTTEPGESTGGDGPRIGDLDGTRPWRNGESQQSIHWASTLRSGEVIAFDRSTSTETRWVLPLTAEATRLRRTMEDGLRHGHDVGIEVDIETGRTEPIRHREDIVVWSAVAAEQQRTPQATPSRLALWRRQISWPRSRESTASFSTRARLLTALAAIIALNMLSGALDASLASRAAVTIGIAITTGLSLWAATGRRSTWTRVDVWCITAAAPSQGQHSFHDFAAQPTRYGTDRAHPDHSQRFCPERHLRRDGRGGPPGHRRLRHHPAADDGAGRLAPGRRHGCPARR